jgi:hypothetical protein
MEAVKVRLVHEVMGVISYKMSVSGFLYTNNATLYVSKFRTVGSISDSHGSSPFLL